jgi:hypothetical protein
MGQCNNRYKKNREISENGNEKSKVFLSWSLEKLSQLNGQLKSLFFERNNFPY